MTTNTWNGVNGDWSDAADWTPSGVPGAGDTADITASGPYTVTVGLSAGSNEEESAAAVKVDDASAVLAINGSLTVGSLTLTAGSVSVNGSASHAATLTLNNAFTDASTGTVWLGGTASLTVTGAYTNNGALDLDIGSLDGGGALTIGGTLTNNGTVQAGPNNLSLSSPTTVTLGALTNASGAIFQVYGSASHAATLKFTGAGFSGNSGYFELYDTAPLTLNNAFTDASTGTVWLGGTASLTVTGAYTNNGALDLDIGSLDGGGALTIGGTLTNNGTVQAGPNNLSLSSPTTVTLGALTNASGAIFQVYGSASHAATLKFTGAGFSGNSGYFELYDTAPLTLNNAFTDASTGTVWLGGTASLTVTGAYTNNGALDLDIGSLDGGGALTIGGTLTNNGTVQAGPNNLSLSSPTTVTLGALTNASGAIFQVYGSASHAATLKFTGAGFSGNSGYFELYDTAPLTLNNAFTDASTGTVWLGGTASLTVTGAYTNNGALDLDIGSLDGGGALTIGGTLTNNGTVQAGPNNLSLSSPTTVTLGALTNASGAIFQVYGSASHAATLKFTGAGFSGNSGYFELYDTAPLTLNNAFTDASTGTVWLGGTASLTVTGAYTNNGALDLDIGSLDGGGALTIGGTLTNNGTVQAGPNNLSLSSPTTVTLGALTNASDAIFQVYGSASHAATLKFTGAGFSGNSGYFELYDTAPLTLNNAFTDASTGTVWLGGTASLTVTGAYTNNGALDLDIGSLDGGGALTIGGTLTNNGTVQAGPNNLSLSSPTTVTLGALTNASGAIFQVYGSASHAATLKFTGAGFSGNSGYFELYDTAPLTLNNAFTDASTGTVWLGGTASLTVTGAYTNNGALDLDIGSLDGGGALTIGGTLTNNGTVQAGPNNLSLSSPTTVTLGALTNASGAIFQVYGSASHAATITVDGSVGNAGSLNVGPYSAFDVTGGGVFTQSGGTTTVNGSFSAATVDVDGGNFVVDTTKYTNIDKLAAADGGYINLSAGGLTNLSAAGTLTGGTYEVDAGSIMQLPNNSPIDADDADIILSGAGSTIEDYNTASGTYSTIDQTLGTIGSAGELQLLADRNWTSAAITNGGVIQLGGGKLTATGSLTDGTGSKLRGFGTVAATTFTNFGLIEASGGALTLTNAVSGTGGLQIDGKADLVVESTTATKTAVHFNGAASTLTLDHLTGFSGSIGGFGLDDAIDLVGITANGASVNGSNQLVVTENGATVATLQLSGNNSGFYFLTQPVSSGTDVISLPIPATVADYLADASLYDKIPGGFSISDTASNISTGLNQLSDSKINAIKISDNGAVKVSVAQLSSDATTIAKLANANGTPYQLAISDAVANVTAALATLNADVGHIASVTSTSGTVKVSEATWVADRTILDKVVDGFAISDSLPNVVSNLSALDGDTHIASIAATSGSATLASGLTITVPAFSLAGSGTMLTVSENLSYAGKFSVGVGSVVSVSAGDKLTLSGTAALSGALAGAGVLATGGATTVAGLTIGGTTTFDNTKTVTESGGSVIVGDASGHAAQLENAATGVWNIPDNSGIGLGSSALSSISNSGTFEKTGGTGTSTIAPAVANALNLLVSSGTLDFKGAVSGTGTDTISGASTLEFDSALSGSQEINFTGSGGTLNLLDPLGYGGSHIENFAAHDSIDVAGAWSLLSFSENPGGTLGTLTLKSGTSSLSLELAGDYTSADFSVHSGSTTIINHT